MSGLNIDSSGLVGAAAQPKKEEVKPAEKPKPAEPAKNVIEHGNKPPPLNVAPGGSSQPKTYNEKLDHAFPVSRNASDPANRQIRETFFLMKDFGYDNFEKNRIVIMKFKDQGKLDDMMGIQ